MTTPTFQIHEKNLLAFIDDRRATDDAVLPGLMSDEQPASGVLELIDALIDAKAILGPDGYALRLINDDETDICGLIVEVEAVGTDWPYASDGWSEIDNYLPAAPGDYADDLRTLVENILGRANRCVQFLARVKAALELVDDVALGNSEYDDLSDRARGVLGHPQVRDSSCPRCGAEGRDESCIEDGKLVDDHAERG